MTTTAHQSGQNDNPDPSFGALASMLLLAVPLATLIVYGLPYLHRSFVVSSGDVRGFNTKLPQTGEILPTAASVVTPDVATSGTSVNR